MVIHLAAKTDVPDSIKNPEITNKVNIEGTANVIKCCIENKIDKIIFASPAAVYAESKSPVSEKSKTKPLSPYGKSKLEGEKLVTKFAKRDGVQAVCLRMFNIYGKGQNKQYAGVITKFIENISRDKPIQINGDGKQTRDFVSIFDVVNAFDCAIKNINGKRGNVYNIGTGKSISINELVEIIQISFDKKTKIKYREHIPGEIKYSIADVSLAKKELGFAAKHKLEKELIKLI